MKTTGTILDEIVAARQDTLQRQKNEISFARIEAELAGMRPDPIAPGFYEALKADHAQPKIIAEAKKASPSEGVLREPFSPPEINSAYQAAKNVVAISVLTEQTYFQGNNATLRFFASHNRQHKPLLRKDFITDPYQVAESRLLGAHAYLLIAILFDKHELSELVAAGADYGVEPLVEIRDQQELETALETDARCIGANCRDLRDFSIDRSVHGLLGRLDDSYARVVESAVNTSAYLGKVAAFSDAALIGTHFMRSLDIPATIETISAST
jgi:indole-3-glycerol phosphate synthase